MASPDWDADASVVNPAPPDNTSEVPWADGACMATTGGTNDRVASSAQAPIVETVSETTDMDTLLAAAIQNTLHMGTDNKDAVDTPPTITEMFPSRPVAPPSTASAPASKKDRATPPNATTGQEKSAATAKPSYWKLAGRAIKKHKAGKMVLHGLRDGYEGTKKTLGIGVGRLEKTLGIGVGRLGICMEETRVYRAEEVVQGFVRMELTEPIAAHCLVMDLLGVRHGETGTETVHMFDYEIGGAQVYPCEGDFPFQVVIPRLQRRMSQETRDMFVGSLISSVQTIGAAMQDPIEWTLTATLHIPGRLSMSVTVRIHVALEDY
jgi:hypothetical protein